MIYTKSNVTCTTSSRFPENDGTFVTRYQTSALPRHISPRKVSTSITPSQNLSCLTVSPKRTALLLHVGKRLLYHTIFPRRGWALLLHNGKRLSYITTFPRRRWVLLLYEWQASVLRHYISTKEMGTFITRWQMFVLPHCTSLKKMRTSIT